MCLAIPGQIIEVLNPDQARVSIGGIEKVIQTQLIDSPQCGDYVLVHVGIALSKIDPLEAKKTLELIKELESFEPPKS